MTDERPPVALRPSMAMAARRWQGGARDRITTSQAARDHEHRGAAGPERSGDGRRPSARLLAEPITSDRGGGSEL